MCIYLFCVICKIQFGQKSRISSSNDIVKLPNLKNTMKCDKDKNNNKNPFSSTEIKIIYL